MFKKGDKVAKLLSINGLETVSISTINAVCKKRRLVSTGDVSKAKDIESDGVTTYRLDDGRAVANYIPGCFSRLIKLDC